MNYSESDFKELKLVIWDLDETFWQGTLSEGAVLCPAEHQKTVSLLNQIGIVNSICSKNDASKTFDELEKLHMRDAFVFCSIDWNPKGERIRRIIEDMQLREQNVLFIDDNPSNRAEAEFCCPKIYTAGPEVIESLYQKALNAYESGVRKDRVKQYKVLESKREEREHFSSNEEFLYASAITVYINECPEGELERLYELNLRSNQLNFTKDRISLSEMKMLLEDPDYRCGSVHVADRFGDYGIVGFYALYLADNSLKHFCFSCRTLGMGIEQYVYRYLGAPCLITIGEIASDPNVPENPAWITRVTENGKVGNDSQEKMNVVGKILLKGPCDLWSICNFYEDDLIDTEFTYTIKKNCTIDFALNHSDIMVQTGRISDREISELETRLPFIGEKTFRTELFSGRYSSVVISTLIDSMLGRYRNRKTGRIIAFGDWNCDLTDPSNWDRLKTDSEVNYGCPFTEEFLSEFTEEWESIGPISVEETVRNFKEIRRRLPNTTSLIIMLGSETPFTKKKDPKYENRHLYYHELNRKMQEELSGAGTYFINPTAFVHGQKDYTDTINHFTKAVYYQMACELNRILGQSSHETLQQKSRAYVAFVALRQRIWQIPVIRTIYYKIRRQTP